MVASVPPHAHLVPPSHMHETTCDSPRSSMQADKIITAKSYQSENANRSRKRRKYDLLETQGTKQAQKARVKGKGKVGQLQGLMSIPMDAMFEIFGHLFPLDLLHLARSTKAFRCLLMSRSSISIWKAARANISGLPEPVLISEPGYANLVFDQHCHKCLQPRIRSVEWRLRLRVCSKCAKTVLGDFSIYAGNDSAHELVPSRPSKLSHVMCVVSEEQAARDRLKSHTDPEERNAYIKERKEIVEAIQTHAFLCEEWAAQTKSNRSQELDDARQDRKKVIIERLTDLGWGEEIEKLRPIDDLSHHALVKQPIRLTDRIWNNIKVSLILHMKRMKSNRLDREREDLVSRRKPVAVDILRRYKILHLPMTEIMPEPVDFCALPEVREILTLPSDVEVDESSFSEVVRILPGIFERWRTDIIQQLAARVRQAEEDENKFLQDNQATTSEADAPSHDNLISDPTETMQLATTVFKCRKCAERFSNFPYRLGDVTLACHKPPLIPDVLYPLHYPEILGHRCLTITERDLPYIQKSDSVAELNEDDSPFGTFQSRRRKAWDCLCLAVDIESRKRMEKIVIACGLDPATATPRAMDELDTRLGCTHCVTWSYPEEVIARMHTYGWRTALHHQSVFHHDKEVPWLRIEGPALEQAKELEQIFLRDLGGENPEIEDMDPPSELVAWLCAHCLDLPSQSSPREFYDVKAHIQTEHNRVFPELDRDYYKDPEYPQGYRTDIVNKMALVHLHFPEESA